MLLLVMTRSIYSLQVIFSNVTVILMCVTRNRVYKPMLALGRGDHFQNGYCSVTLILIVQGYCKAQFHIVHWNNSHNFNWKSILMPSTRRQKAKASKSRELDMLSDYGNMDIMLGEGTSNSIQRELDGLIKVPERHRDFQSFPNRENSSQENEIRDIDSRNEPVRESRLVESINMLSGEMNARMSREMEAMMDLMQSQISRAISSAISERIIPEIQKNGGKFAFKSTWC